MFRLMVKFIIGITEPIKERLYFLKSLIVIAIPLWFVHSVIKM